MFKPPATQARRFSRRLGGGVKNFHYPPQKRNEEIPIGSSLRPVQLGISARGGILISAYTKKYTKGETIKKFLQDILGGYCGPYAKNLVTIEPLVQEIWIDLGFQPTHSWKIR